jgi:hypothetical protein
MIFAGTNTGVYASTDSGGNWTQSGLTALSIYSLAIRSGYLFAGTSAGVYTSSDSGKSWTQSYSGLKNISVNTLAFSGTLTVAGTTSGVYVSSDSGTSWTASGLNGLYVYSLFNDTSGLFAGTNSGAYISTDRGASWISLGLSRRTVLSFLPYGNTLIAGADSGNVFLTNNSGTTWAQVSMGMPLSSRISSLAIDGTELFAGTTAGVGTGLGVWKRPLSELTAVDSWATQLPNHFTLEQNYPNPFNPSTIITYQLPKNVVVTLKVYDVLGREVRTLVSGPQTGGIHSVTFNAGNMSSGVYFYRLQAGAYSQTKKLLLLK